MQGFGTLAPRPSASICPAESSPIKSRTISRLLMLAMLSAGAENPPLMGA